MKKYFILVLIVIAASLKLTAQTPKSSSIKMTISEKKYVDYRNVLQYKLSTVDHSKINTIALIKDLFATKGFKDINLSDDVTSDFTIYINGDFPLNKSNEILQVFKVHNISIVDIGTKGGR
jgi:hypothetical protein